MAIFEQARAAPDDVGELADVVVVEPEGDPEAVAERATERARARGGGDHREAVEAEAQRLRAGARAGDEVEGEVLHRRVQRLLDGVVEAVDLVDEEDVAVVERGEDRGEHALVLERRAPRSGAPARPSRWR